MNKFFRLFFVLIVMVTFVSCGGAKSSSSPEVTEIELIVEPMVEEPAVDFVSVLAEPIFFTFDSYKIDGTNRALLKKKAKILQAQPEIVMVVEGHCDKFGTKEYNMALGERRAVAVADFIGLLGITADRLPLVSYGEERPLVKGDTKADMAQNRRVEFRIK